MNRTWTLPYTLAAALICSGSISAQSSIITGYARLPADTFRDGPPSTNSPAGILPGEPPQWASQPVQGISALRLGPDGSYWALSDNGFGTQRNSATYLLAIYRLEIDWRTREGGTGDITILETVELTDRRQHAGNISGRNDPDRHLTGADFDPESLQQGSDGSFWIGDEFGPWLLHFSRTGELLQAPIPARFEDDGKWSDVRAPERNGFGRKNLKSSRGFEGLTYLAKPAGLYMMLEGALDGEDPNWLRLFAYRTGGSSYVESTPWKYRLSNAGNSVGELTYWTEKGFYLVLERDWGHGQQAQFKKIFAWDPQVGQAAKELVADLMAMDDPDHLASDADTYDLPYVTIESLLPIDSETLIVANDNNYPAVGGRSTALRDATEFVRLRIVNNRAAD